MEIQQPLGLLEVDYGDLEFFEKCGGGAFGSVYRALWKSKQAVVAVKKVLVLEKEAHVLSILSHRNIIQFFGAVTKPPNYCLVTEYAENGNLYSYLATHQGDKMLDFDHILQWALDISQGMNYLHTQAPVKVIHRDLKSKNVVLSTNFICKLCDFGASRFHGSTTKMSLAGTLPWMAPEVIQSLPTSEASDIWSYGVVLWELLTHEVPFKGIEGFQIAWLVVEKNERLVIPATCPAVLATLLKMTWCKESHERPTCGEIIEYLTSLQKNDTVSETYMRNRSLWKNEIEITMERINNKEKNIIQRQIELQEWERRLEQKEQTLDRQLYLKQLNSHDVNCWTEDDVFLWLKQLVTEDHMKDMACYVNLFKQHNISGRSLLLLTQSDLQAMGITSIGHIKALHHEIEQLYFHNKRMLDFPPLENIVLELGNVNKDLPTARVKLVLVFGSHIRRGGHTGEHKWKMYVEVDENDNPQAKGCVKKVAFRYQESEQIVQHPPFVMESWNTGISDDTIVDCTVSYSALVKKPKQSRYRHKIRLENTKVHQREVTLLLKPVESCKMLNTAQRRTTSNKRNSSSTNFGPWQTNANFIHPTLSSKYAQSSKWAKVVASKIPAPSLVSSPSTHKLNYLDPQIIDVDSAEKIKNSTTTNESRSQYKNMKHKDRKLLPSSKKFNNNMLLRATGIRTKHRRGSKVRWQQQQLQNPNDIDINFSVNKTSKIQISSISVTTVTDMYTILDSSSNNTKNANKLMTTMAQTNCLSSVSNCNAFHDHHKEKLSRQEQRQLSNDKITIELKSAGKKASYETKDKINDISFGISKLELPCDNTSIDLALNGSQIMKDENILANYERRTSCGRGYSGIGGFHRGFNSVTKFKKT